MMEDWQQQGDGKADETLTPSLNRTPHTRRDSGSKLKAHSSQLSPRLSLSFLRPIESVPRLITALGQSDTFFYLLAICPRKLEDGLFAMVFREDADRFEQNCEALFGRMNHPGALDSPNNDATAAQVWDDFYYLHRAAENEPAGSDSLPGQWEGYFEPEEHPPGLVIRRELQPERFIWIVTRGDGWEVRLGAGLDDAEQVTQASGIREAFEQAIRAAGGKPVREALRAPDYRRTKAAGGAPLRRW